MIVASLIAYAGCALFLFFAVTSLVVLWRGVRRNVDEKISSESVSAFWSCLFIAFVLAMIGGLLW